MLLKLLDVFSLAADFIVAYILLVGKLSAYLPSSIS